MLLVELLLMASIWKQSRSPYWTACWRDAGGQQRRRSTKTTDRRLAQRIAQEFETATRKKRTLHQLEKVLRTYHEELCGESTQSRSLRTFCLSWLSEKEPSVSAATIKFYRAVVDKLCTFLGPKADQPIAEITRAELVAFRNTIAGGGASASTVNHDLVAIRMIFGDARRRGCLAENPAESIKPVREFTDPDAAPRRPFTIPELQAVLAIADPEWQSMIRIGLYSAARLADIALLRWNNIDLERSELRFTARKTRNATCVPIAGPLRDVLLSLPSSDDPRGFLHPRAAANMEKQGTSASLSTQFGGLLERASLRPAYRRPRPGTPRNARHRMSPLTFHSLRHTAVSLLKDAGIPQAVVQELVGHSSAQMNQRYTHVGIESLQRAAAVLPIL
jgi:integrase